VLFIQLGSVVSLTTYLTSFMQCIYDDVHVYAFMFSFSSPLCWMLCRNVDFNIYLGSFGNLIKLTLNIGLRKQMKTSRKQIKTTKIFLLDPCWLLASLTVSWGHYFSIFFAPCAFQVKQTNPKSLQGIQYTPRKFCKSKGKVKRCTECNY